jgi:hypothetical protein
MPIRLAHTHKHRRPLSLYAARERLAAENHAIGERAEYTGIRPRDARNRCDDTVLASQWASWRSHSNRTPTGWGPVGVLNVDRIGMVTASLTSASVMPMESPDKLSRVRRDHCPP